jgi:oligopeptide transport system permease protein
VTRFLLRRALWFVLTLWAVITLSFFLMRAVPGGPFTTERGTSASFERSLRERYHLDWPAWKQYLQYVGPLNLDAHGAIGGDGTQKFAGLLAGDFGPSLRYRDFTVNDILAQSLPISIQLGLLALFWALALGLPAGVYSALRPGTRLDVAVRVGATIGMTLPNFVIASLLSLVFAFLIPLAPIAGWGTLRHMLLPSIALGLPSAASIARLTRTGLLEVLSQDYIRAAVAKGLSDRTVLLRHALRPALLPVLSYLGPATAGILTGSLVIEKIFFIPGTGSHFVNSALNRDYTLAMGVTILYTTLVYLLNTLVDIGYTLLDPRVGLEEGR